MDIFLSVDFSVENACIRVMPRRVNADLIQKEGILVLSGTQNKLIAYH